MIDWGSVPDWLSGAGATLALLFAALAVRGSVRANAQQSAQLELAEQDRRIEHASKIAAWPITGDDGHLTCTVRNGSQLPVFEVLLFRGLADVSGFTWWTHCRHRLIPPGETRDRDWTETPPPFEPAANNTDSNLAAIAFLDGSGRYWLRDCFGKLHRLGQVPDLYLILPNQWTRGIEEETLQILYGSISIPEARSE